MRIIFSKIAMLGFWKFGKCIVITNICPLRGLLTTVPPWPPPCPNPIPKFFFGPSTQPFLIVQPADAKSTPSYILGPTLIGN